MRAPPDLLIMMKGWWLARAWYDGAGDFLANYGAHRTANEL